MSEKVSLARLDVRGNHFEVLVDSERALDYKLKRTPWSDKILKFEEVFRDYKKGERASRDALLKAFSTDDPRKICKVIIDDGELQVPAHMRRKLLEEKRKTIMVLIARVSIDPQTNTPIPLLRVEQAFDKISIPVDPSKEPIDQLKPIIREMKRILPMKVKEAEIEAEFPPDLITHVRGYLESVGEMVIQPRKRGDLLTMTVKVPEAARTDIVQKVAKRFGEKVKVTLV
ncbi:MAG TPA: ribosome assembly factor SBDS [Thermoproteota archaeon]|nr:ribosome assembly factor SBDS [Thermoproteota archaeon]